MRTSDITKILLGSSIAVVLLYFVFKDIDWLLFWGQLNEVEIKWTFFSVVLSVIAYMIRAYRWNILLAPLGYTLRTSQTTLAVVIGYLANLAIPRMGEITRCGILKEREDVKISHSIGSVIAERILDMLSLLLLFFVSLFMSYQRIIDFFRATFQSIALPSYIFYAFPVVFVLAIVVFYFIVRMQPVLKEKLMTLGKQLLEGLLSIRKIKNVKGFIISTILLWVIYFFMTYIMIFSLPETSNLGLSVGFMLLVIGGIAISIPVQSGFGTYHAMISGILILYGINKTTSLFLATLLHTTQIISVAVFGFIALIYISIQKKKKNLVTK